MGIVIDPHDVVRRIMSLYTQRGTNHAVICGRERSVPLIVVVVVQRPPGLRIVNDETRVGQGSSLKVDHSNLKLD